MLMTIQKKKMSFQFLDFKTECRTADGVCKYNNRITFFIVFDRLLFMHFFCVFKNAKP